MNELIEQLQLLRFELNKNYSQLIKIKENRIVKVQEFWFNSHVLLMDENRSCRIYNFSNEQKSKFVFEWDDCPIFEISSSDIKRQGEIITCWVFEKSMPSIMQNKFPEIEFNELSKYYEKGEGIKGEFIQSWNSIEKFYSEYFSDESKTQEEDTLKLIKEMRDLELDEKLRAGQSLWFFILSRSRRHGLKENTPYVQITFLGNNRMTIESHFDGKKTSLESEVKYEGYLKDSIKKLLKEKIK